MERKTCEYFFSTFIFYLIHFYFINSIVSLYYGSKGREKIGGGDLKEESSGCGSGGGFKNTMAEQEGVVDEMTVATDRG